MSNLKTINLIIFGIGNVGSTLIKQIEAIRNELLSKQSLQVRIPVIANSKQFFATEGIAENNWQIKTTENEKSYKIQKVIDYVNSKNLDNLIAIDATASESFVTNYETLIDNGFHIVAANKVANTLDFNYYKSIRKTLENNNKKFLYETNVGAGLPIIETIKNLRDSGEQIEKIRGVFSGSLSYIFNRFSSENLSFSEVLKAAEKEGLTEPDARDDLSGKDVARKLLILARELGLKQELKHVKVQSLVPKQLNGKTTTLQFKKRLKELDKPFLESKKTQKPDSVLRYVGELNVQLQTLEVKLISESKSTPLGQLKGSDTLFEIYTESYNAQPLVIQGAGAGKVFTARGLLSDVIKLSNQLN